MIGVTGLRERKHPYCGRPEYARGVRLSPGGSIYDPADPVSKMFSSMLAVFAEFRVWHLLTARLSSPKSRDPERT